MVRLEIMQPETRDLQNLLIAEETENRPAQSRSSTKGEEIKLQEISQ